MNYEQINYEAKNGILTITLNRPDKLNAFTGRMLSELLDAMDRADRDDDVRAVVFTGAGRGFCAGADLSGGANTFDALMHAVRSCSLGEITDTLYEVGGKYRRNV